MGRTSNPDYFKVAGASVGERDTVAASRMWLATERAELRRQAKVAPRPPPKLPKASKTSPRTAPVPLPVVLPTRRPEAVAVASVTAIASDKPRHGQKRRSTRKKHEVRLVGELRSHPEETPSEAAYAVRHERPPAEVIDVREGVRRRAAKAAGKRPPEKAPKARAPEGLGDLARRLLADSREELIQRTARAVRLLTELVDLPFSVARVLRDLRHREA